MRLSIRWRLTLWNTLALAVVLACFALMLYGLQRRALIEQTDRQLQAGLTQLRRDPLIETDVDRCLRHWVEEYKDHLNLFCVIYRGGVLYARTPGLAEQSAPALPEGPFESLVYNEELPIIGRQRIMAEQVRAGGQEFVVLLLAPLAPVDRELGRVRDVLLTAGPLAVLLSAALAYWLACKALAPMDRLRRATDAITADRLDQRLPAANPHDELGRLTGTINAMIARLERSFAEIRRFTADASHELRTPLTVLRTEVEVGLGKQLTLDEHEQLLGNILEELVRMSRLTDQLLALSRRDAGVEHLKAVPLELNALVRDVVNAMQPLAEAKGVLLQLAKEVPAPIEGEAGRLRQVFINLLDNAVKYTPEGGKVVIHVGTRGRSAVVTVQDTGVGIAPEHLPHVFDRFYRVDPSRSRAEGGTGLGLSIASSIVKLHGGTVEMTSARGQGTRCTVTLPREPDAGRTGGGDGDVH